jgi:hypothetical protein
MGETEVKRLVAAREAACARAQVLLRRLPRIGDDLDPQMDYIHLYGGYLLPIGD